MEKNFTLKNNTRKGIYQRKGESVFRSNDNDAR